MRQSGHGQIDRESRAAKQGFVLDHGRGRGSRDWGHYSTSTHEGKLYEYDKTDKKMYYLKFKILVLNSSGIKPITPQAAFKGSTASLPSSLTPKSRSPTAPIKCPNVLIYCDNTEVYESIKSLMRQTLKKYRFLYLDLKFVLL
jgi:hypothetical protein